MSEREGQQLGNYRLTRFIGQGGFAAVYLAEHIYLGTLAAIKVLDTHLTDDEIDHFCHEARTIAGLEHPHIVRVLDFGVERGLPFLVMSYAPHGTLRQRHPRNARLSPALVVSYVRQIASALQFAHDARLIHRDIKPENMLLGRNQEILISDFGLAVVAQSSSRSGTADVSGTVVYMAPEQARGKPQRASDQYALAVMVYEWLSGNRPFHGSYEEVVVQHAFNPPPSLRHSRNPQVSCELEKVVLRALEKDPARRFPRIQDFAEALDAALQPGQTIALPDTNTIMPPIPATPLLEQSPAQERSSSGQITYALAWSPDRKRIALGGKDRTIEVRGTTTGVSSLVYREHTGIVTGIAWSPDGQFIASASLDRSIQVWNTHTGIRVATYTAHQGMISALAWSPDGRFLASTSSGSDNAIHIWYASTGNQHLVYRGHSHWVRTLAWSHNGQTIASGSWHEVQVWSTLNGQKHLSYRGHQNWLRSINWSPRGTRIASTGEDNTVQVWEPFNKGHLTLTYRGHSDHIHTVLWSPDGHYLASAGKDNTVHIWDAEQGRQIAAHRVRSNGLYAITWLADSKHVVSANDTGLVQLWNIASPSTLSTRGGDA